MELVEVDRYESPWEAHIAAGRLEVEGLYPVVVHQFHIGAYWPLSLALGWVKIQVAKHEEGHALEILGLHRSGRFQELLMDEFPGSGSDTCPNCGSADVRRKLPIVEQLLCITLVLIPAIFPLRHSICNCNGCDHVWKD